MLRYPREGAGMCSTHVSSTHTHLQSMAKGLRRSLESAAKQTGWSSDLALCKASKWHFFAFLEDTWEDETPYPTPEYHDLGLEPAGGRAQGPLGADGKTTTSFSKAVPQW